MPDAISLAIIGGSGLYRLDGIEAVREYDLVTPFGRPSAPILSGSIENHRVAFLARHGIGHQISPSEVPYQANVYALKTLGVERIISISACGSLREDLMPGHVVIPDQLFDHTRGRPRTFFEGGIVAHLSVPDPFCADLSGHVARAVNEAGAVAHSGGTFITVEGPRFSTRAESRAYRDWGMAIIGMTTSPEAFLAREAELCYAVLAHVTDYDVWHLEEQPVTVEMVVQQLRRNALQAEAVLRHLVRDLPFPRACPCPSALEDAFVTPPNMLSPEIRQRLGLLVEHYPG
jgi:5'-methylthioadenosine phosphorylase